MLIGKLSEDLLVTRYSLTNSMRGNRWLLISFVLLLAFLITRQPALLVITLLFFLTSATARLWSRYSLQRLEYKFTLSNKKVFSGENITLDLALGNNKFLPLPWVNIEENVPAGVTFLKGKIIDNGKSEPPVLNGLFNLGWYYRITRRYPVKCMKRGVFEFGPGLITSGDPFGFFRNSQETSQTDRLTVYPRILPLESLGIPSRHPFGDLRLKRHLYEDPVQVMTTRDYVSGDPLKRIHWKASAHTGRLQSKIFEHSTTMDLALFLDTRTAGGIYYWNWIVPDLLETGILAAAAISSYCINHDYKIGLYANECYTKSAQMLRVPSSESPEQFQVILEALANIRGLSFVSIDKLLTQEAKLLPRETTIVLILTVMTDETIAVIAHLKHAGRQIVLVTIGKEFPAVNLNGITVYNISEDIYSNQEQSMSLNQTEVKNSLSKINY